MLGHHSEASLAAMQIAGPLEWSVWSVFSAFTVGTIARVGRHVGAGDRAAAGNAARASIAYAVGCGLVVTLVTPALVLGLGRVLPRAAESWRKLLCDPRCGCAPSTRKRLRGAGHVGVHLAARHHTISPSTCPPHVGGGHQRSVDVARRYGNDVLAPWRGT